MKALSFDDYPLRIFVADRQLSVQFIEIQCRYQKKHLEEIEQLLMTPSQKHFLSTLLVVPGVLKITLHVNEIWVWKQSGYEWSSLEEHIMPILMSCPISSYDLVRETEILVQAWKIAPLYTDPHFRKYLKLSITIFGKQYTSVKGYRQHEKWNDFLIVLREAFVEKIVIVQGRIIGSIAQEYICFPITPNSVPEEKIRRDYPIIAEEILL